MLILVQAVRTAPICRQLLPGATLSRMELIMAHIFNILRKKAVTDSAIRKAFRQFLIPPIFKHSSTIRPCKIQSVSIGSNSCFRVNAIRFENNGDSIGRRFLTMPGSQPYIPRPRLHYATMNKAPLTLSRIVELIPQKLNNLMINPLSIIPVVPSRMAQPMVGQVSSYLRATEDYPVIVPFNWRQKRRVRERVRQRARDRLGVPRLTGGYHPFPGRPYQYPAAASPPATRPYQPPVPVPPAARPYQLPVPVVPASRPYQYPVGAPPAARPYQHPVGSPPAARPYQPSVGAPPAARPYQPSVGPPPPRHPGGAKDTL